MRVVLGSKGEETIRGEECQMRGKDGTGDGKRRAGRKGAVPKIIAEPSDEELRPSEEERQEVEHLLGWEKRSKERDWVVGRPCR